MHALFLKEPVEVVGGRQGERVAILPIPFSKYIKQKKTRKGGRYETVGGKGEIETTKYIANGNETKH